MSKRLPAPAKPATWRAMWRRMLLCMAVLSFSGAGMGATASQPRSAPPNFEIITLAGEAYTNVSLKGHPTLLVFWAPWCNVCERELPLLSDYSRTEKPSQLKIISIGFADTRANVEAFIKSRATTFVFPTAYDDDRWLAQAFKINATPTYVLLDAQGLIVLTHRGGGLLQNPQLREFMSTLKA